MWKQFSIISLHCIDDSRVLFYFLETDTHSEIKMREHHKFLHLDENNNIVYLATLQIIWLSYIIIIFIFKQFTVKLLDYVIIL